MPIERYSPFEGGAVSTIIMQTAKQLLAKGHRVSVLTARCTSPTYDVAEVHFICAPSKADLSVIQRISQRIQNYFQHWDWPYYGAYIKSAQMLLKKLQPEMVVVFNDYAASAYIRKVLPFASIAVWIQNEQTSANKNLESTISSNAVIMTCSEYIKNWTTERYPITAGKILTNISGVDRERYFPPLDPVGRRAASEIKIIAPGRLDYNKGQDAVIDAVKHVASLGFRVQLTVAGDVWFFERPDSASDPFKKKLIESVRHCDFIRFAGHVPQHHMPQLYREHDISMILSRTNEPLGLVALEAMASGCATIASNRGGLPEACGEAGILVNPSDSEEVKNALLNLCNDENLLQVQKNKSILRSQSADWSDCAERLLLTYAREQQML